MNFLQDIQNAFLPELVLTLCILINILLSMFIGKKQYKIARMFAIISVILTAVSMLFIQVTQVFAFANSFVSNNFCMFFKLLVLASSLFVILLSEKTVKKRIDKAFEYFTFILTSVLASMCLISSNDFLTMFVSIELLGICCYMLTAFTKTYKSNEAALKYLIMGCVATAVMLFGISYMYGFTGLLNFDAINTFYTGNFPTIVFSFALLLIVFGLLFKVAAIPFHNWIPDIYEGSEYPVAAFLSVVPKLAGFVILLKIMIAFGIFSPIVQIILVVLATISIIYGNIGALRQKNTMRFFGYSSIAHSGYVLLGFCALYSYNVSVVMFYLFCYAIMNIGAFATLIYLNKTRAKNNILDLRGTAYTNPFCVLAFAICLFSLAGLPVTSGFWAKIYLFSSVVRSGYMFLPFLLLALLASVVGVFIYLNILKIMFERTDEIAFFESKMSSVKFVLYFCSVLTFLLGIFANHIISLCIKIAFYL